MSGIKELAAKVRNLFCVADFQKRDGDGVIQVRTCNGKVLEKAEAFPYGFYAKAKSGKALVFCRGGNFDGFEILPVLKDSAAAPPSLEEGDAALYTKEGGRVIVREAGDVEVLAPECGTLLLANGKADMRSLLLGLIDEIEGIVTSGSPASQTVNTATRQKLEMYKNKVKELFSGGV